ncbi:hypothetical protein Tco_0504417, partial [Tanacetum coccineum]
MKRKFVEMVKMNWIEMILHQPCDQVEQMRRDDLEWWRRS